MTENEAIEELRIEFLGDSDRQREAKNLAIKTLEELRQYRAIGTVEECRAAMEKQMEKKITHPCCRDKDGVLHTWNGINGVPYDLCPNCRINLCTDGFFGLNKKELKYCKNCGQKLDWSDEE